MRRWEDRSSVWPEGGSTNKGGLMLHPQLSERAEGEREKERGSWRMNI